MCQDCYDKECVSKQVHKIAKRKLGNKADNYEKKIEDEGDNFVISYINQEYRNDPLKKGGDEIMIKISKKECRIVEYKRFK
jgi:hypothetical protein